MFLWKDQPHNPKEWQCMDFLSVFPKPISLSLFLIASLQNLLGLDIIVYQVWEFWWRMIRYQASWLLCKPQSTDRGRDSQWTHNRLGNRKPPLNSHNHNILWVNSSKPQHSFLEEASQLTRVNFDQVCHQQSPITWSDYPNWKAIFSEHKVTKSRLIYSQATLILWISSLISFLYIIDIQSIH